MNLDLMVVLSMRQKEMAYHQQQSAVFAQRAPPPRSPLSLSAKQQQQLLPRGAVSPLSVGGALPLGGGGGGGSAFDHFGYAWHWIAGVCAHFALQRQSAHLAAQYAHVLLRRRALLRESDGYYSRFDDRYDDTQRELQLLGLACVFMAAKIEEVHPPKAADLAAFASKHGAVRCAGDDLVRYESEYLVELNWNLHPTTPLAWLLFLLAGDSSEMPLDTMGDFVNPRHNLSGTKDLFVHAVRLLDVALLDCQSADFLPSVLAGSALLLVDASLDFLFVAQFLQLDPNVLWECKTWLYGLVYGVSDWECVGSQDRDRWEKVPDEELLFLQTHLAVPPHLAYGLLRPESAPFPCGQACNQLLSCGCDGCCGSLFGSQYTALTPTMCASPSSSDNYNYSCTCKDGYHTCGGYGPHVYHFKYGWQGVDGGLSYDASAPQEAMRYA